MIHRDINPRLVQRLNNSLLSVNPFNSTDKEAQDSLDTIVGFDYMGAAEFEYGAVTECLDVMSNSDYLKLTSFALESPDVAIDKPCSIYVVRLSIIKDEYDSEWDEKCSVDDVNEAIIINYRKGYDRFIKDRGYTITKNDYGSFFKVLNHDKFFSNKTRENTVGWLDVENRFAWFTDKQVAQNFYIHLVPKPKYSE